jgi:hypothetical protein
MSLVIFLFMFIGLTVHFWNGMWMFWGLCIGIRVSLSEHSKYHAPAASIFRQARFAIPANDARWPPEYPASRLRRSIG